MNKNYRIINHTADVGIKVWAASLDKLFEKAGAAFCDLICDQNTLDQKLTRHVHLKKDSLEELLHDFLNKNYHGANLSKDFKPFCYSVVFFCQNSSSIKYYLVLSKSRQACFLKKA